MQFFLPIDRTTAYQQKSQNHAIDYGVSSSDYLFASKEKIRAQSFFMLTTCQPPDLAAFSEALSFSV